MQVGLQGVSFGNLLIKRVVASLQKDLPNIDTFVTLSPIPGFGAWFREQMCATPDALERLTTAQELTGQRELSACCYNDGCVRFR